MAPYASAEDYEECRRLHRAHGTTYFFASRRFAPEIRRRVDALYAFVRVPDEWVDNPGEFTPKEQSRKIDQFEGELLAGIDGQPPSSPVLRAFCDTVLETAMDPAEPLEFLGAMRADLHVRRYATYEELRGYMRGSAVAVALMMCHLLGAPNDLATRQAATALGEAMQMTNFLRDVGEDVRRGRIYLPLEDLERFGVTEGQIERGDIGEAWADLMRFEIDRSRALYALADEGIPRLPEPMRLPVMLARELYSRILDRIEDRRFDVFTGRARTSSFEKALVAASVAFRARTSVG